MAYMVDGRGPFPNKAGEWCGNRYTSDPIPLGMRIGRPRPDKTRTTAKLESQGYCGVYWLRDQGTGADLECNRGKEMVEVPAPPSLTEPVAGEGE